MTKKTNKIRIARFLANCGIASRRQAEEIVSQGRVRIGDEIVTNLASKVDKSARNVYVDNKQVVADKKVYYLLNKPKGYICSVKDPHNKNTVLSLVPSRPRVVPVGRLDKDSQGLLLLTNDGNLAYQLTHPKFEVQKNYLVKLNKDISKDLIAALKQGIKLEEGLAKADKVKKISNKEIEITIHQGWKRQIRRMISERNYKVVELTRIGEGKLKLDNLVLGEYKVLNKSDIV
jgi:23S rRNA pseudouridine2605 synthase